VTRDYCLDDIQVEPEIKFSLMHSGRDWPDRPGLSGPAGRQLFQMQT